MKKYEIIKPDYYDRFQCKASSCRYSCCEGWNITLSKEEVRRTKRLMQENSLVMESEVFERLSPKERSKAADSRMVLDEKQRCPFFGEDALCILQSNCGADALSMVCRTYPRQVYGYGDILFHSCSLGCEKVLEMILQTKDHITLVSSSEYMEPQESVKHIIYHGKGEQVLTGIYFDVFNFCTALLQAEGIEIEDRLILLGIGMKQVDKLMDERRTLEVPQYLEQYLSTLETMEDDVSSLLPPPRENTAVLLSNLFLTDEGELLEGLKYGVFSKEIRKNLNVVVKIEDGEELYSYSPEVYAELKKEYKDFMKDKEYFMENILLSFMYFKRFPFNIDWSKSVWENYMYFAWFSGIIKFFLTASMPQVHSDEDMIDRLVYIFRRWGQSNVRTTDVLKLMRADSCDDLPHLALLLKSC